ncbi:MAG TPA: RNA polymerase sigma-70 factor [Prevotella sp.]|nr:RNA polymerase sigma-70 factor [Prevotella sp.]
MSDRNKIERLFKDNWDALCIFSLHFVGDMDTAEDVVMDCFLKLSERIGHGDEILTPKHYLYQMVRNGSLDKARHVGQTVQLTETSRTSEDLDDVSERSVREARLWTAIDSLPPVRREVLLMSKRDGMHNDEISQTLGISVKTVEAHLYKAYKTLRGKAKEIYLLVFF